MRRALIFLVLIAFGALALAPARAQDDIEARLREALRTSTTQMRDAQDQLAAVQAKEAEAERQNASLRQQLQALGGAGSARPAQADNSGLRRAIAEFNTKLAAQNEAIAKWKAAYDDLVAHQPDQKAIQAQLDDLTKRNAVLQAKNDALFKTANYILDRYAHINFSDVMNTREPFVGSARVDLENEVQDDRDKILDQRAAP